MKLDYKKLTEDLIKAKEAAKKAVMGEDGGTANLDSMTIALPGVREEKVIQAVKDAGLYTRGRRKWIGTRYFISIPIAAQGNDGCRQVDAMCEVMQKQGYDVLAYHQID